MRSVRLELFAPIRRDARIEGLSMRELARKHGGIGARCVGAGGCAAAHDVLRAVFWALSAAFSSAVCGRSTMTSLKSSRSTVWSSGPSAGRLRPGWMDCALATAQRSASTAE
jgi:hypothetical protein